MIANTALLREPTGRADLARAHRAATSNAGTVWVNTYLRVDPAVPYGGVKQSGFGRNLGANRQSRAYALEKCVDKHRMREIVALLLHGRVSPLVLTDTRTLRNMRSHGRRFVDGARIGLFQQEPSEW